MSRPQTPSYRKVGRAYGIYVDKHRPWDRRRHHVLMEYECQTIPVVNLSSGGCCHFDCHMAMLRAEGLGHLADRLEGNSQAKDYRHNWGKMIYVDSEHGRDPIRRKMMAQAMRAMRDKHKTNYADIIVAGSWAGALVGVT